MTLRHIVRPFALLLLLAAATSPVAAQAGAPRDTLHVYGPGGPLPAMKEAAAEFARRHGIVVEVTGGPTTQWIEKARGDADLIFAGSGHMMADFVRELRTAGPGRIIDSTITPLYLRASAILVRKGNPRGIRRFEDLLRPGLRILVVNGAGQVGLWEDMAGRTGDIEVVRAFRRNIAAQAPSSGEAKRMWTEDASYDAWVIWTIWQVANPELADLVPVRDPWVIYRGTGVALTSEGIGKAHARELARFLLTPEAARIFEKWGWMTRPPARRAPRTSGSRPTPAARVPD